MTTSKITFFLNGNEVTVDNPDPELTLATFLRYKLHLTGTKLACEEGACGSCTVAIARWNKEERKAKFVSANACITPLYLVDGALVLTVEGIGSQKRLHPIQERLSSGNATQCGFCSPGFVMTAYALLRNNPSPTADEIRSALVGNLCRCTGYRPILEALESFARPSGGCCMGGKGGCPCKDGKSENGVPEKSPDVACGLVNYEQMQKFDETSEIIFPPTLIVASEQQTLSINGKRITLYSPTTLEELSAKFKSLPNVDNIVSTGILARFNHSQVPSPAARSTWLSIQRIETLKKVDVVDGEILIGSGLSISEFLSAIRSNCKTAQYVDTIEELYAKYSSDQVKNTASWSGALATAAAKFDICTLFLALNWRVRLYNLSTSSYRTLTADQLFSGVNGSKTALASSEVITALLVPVAPTHRIASFKHGMRFGADDAVLNAAASYQAGTGSCRIAVGAYHKPLLLQKTAQIAELRLKSGSSADISTAVEADFEVFSDQKDVDYKRSIAKAAVIDMLSVLAGEERDGLDVARNALEPLQLYKAADDSITPVGRPLRHAAADRHTTGEAQYVDDVKIHDLKHAALVHSTEAHARILSIDPSEALAVEGVLAYVDATVNFLNNLSLFRSFETRDACCILSSVLSTIPFQDLPPGGLLRPCQQPFIHLQDNAPVFAEGVVEMVGQPIGCIVAEDVQTARRAAKLVRVEYERLPAILTMEEAIAARSYLSEKPEIYGKSEEDIEAALKAAPILLEGECSIGGQEHMYFETQSSVVVPMENDEWTVYTSTQSPSDAQYLCAAILGIPANNVVIKVKRLGGGFGGKGTGDRIPRGPAMVAANKIRKPVSCVLHRYDDVAATGKRHPALFKYRVGIDGDGRLLAVHVLEYLQGGYSTDHSLSVATVIQYADACFHVPAMRGECWALKTNTTSNTAFRAYGRPQTFFFMETLIAKVAQRVGRPLNEVKRLNLAREGDIALCGSRFNNFCLPECWNEVERFSQFDKLQKECDAFNKNSARIKRGVAISGTVQGLTIPGFMEQGTALVQLLLDGTVRINVGTVEMGQGLNTKITQIAAAALNVPYEKVLIIEMATDKTANTVESGGSIGTDICGHAVKKACEKLLEGIKPHMEQCDGDFVKALAAAWMAKVPLQASETVSVERKAHAMPDNDHPYFTSGAACVLVEVDCLTGEHKLKSVDIVMDVGDSINPALDIGQIEGGFIQGYGLTTSEEIGYDESGRISNGSLYSYKIPTVHMVPEHFRVKLLEKGRNYPGQIYRSKGIGEPPLLLATAVHSALRIAIDSYSSNANSSVLLTFC
ncbi:gad-3 [Pristionchus pacificus]|uniref:Gad-3 n=1 Tax=Pristionchus pacificus TaxID=54126 RepID=A0A2A6B4C8_PRIPA|nr:gad-3 [Pristionchus pacificus]|eukprot:PDM60732.1 gad-3 [Pristionchus pacificus]